MINNKGIYIGHADQVQERQCSSTPETVIINMDKRNSIIQELSQCEWSPQGVMPIAEKLEKLCCDKDEPGPSPDDCAHAPVKEHDPVNRPSHYTYGTIETIDYIEDKGQNFNLGNAVKYVSRAGHKLDAVEDLKKAVWYIQREISRLQKEKNHA